MSGDDPQWPRASAWLALNAHNPRLAVVGVPVNQSITSGRCDLAPGAIREALRRFSTYDTETAVDLNDLAVKDFGDVTDLTQTGVPTIFLGGDNNVTRLAVQSLGVPLKRCGLITFDAHHDVRDTGNGFHNGNPVRASIESGLPGTNVVQIGIQPFANSKTYAAYAHDRGITVITADAVYDRGISSVVRDALDRLGRSADAIYVDLDLDVLDRAFAPACPGARPGGLQPWMLRRAARICGAHAKVRAMDLVEVDPTKDIADTTCLAAAAFLLAFASGVASRQ